MNSHIKWSHRIVIAVTKILPMKRGINFFSAFFEGFANCYIWEASVRSGSSFVFFPPGLPDKPQTSINQKSTVEET